MRNTNELPPCPLRFGGMCMENVDRAGRKEPYYNAETRCPRWEWRRFPFFSPVDCWEKIKKPLFRIVRTKRGREKQTRRPSKCPMGWALDKDTGEIYRWNMEHR